MTPLSPILKATRVVATDLETGKSEAIEIKDNYVLIADGSAHVASTTMHLPEDGTVTYVITVKGCRP